MMDSQTKQKVSKRMRRISGQVGGIQRMIDEDRYCIDVLTQIEAARAALAKVGALLLESHLQTCVTGAFRSEDASDRSAKIAELVSVFEKGLK